MADRTNRIAQNNLAILAATVITASSADASFPVAWLRDPIPTKRWRSKLGWNIVTGFNDTIDFNRGGVKAAAIAAGNYATGSALATVVQTAMTAADAGATWTVTYSAVTKLFTISANLAFTLLFGSGTNVTKSAGPDLGFAVADTASSTSQVAGLVSYHSREYLLFDLGSAQAATLGVAHGHNMGSGGTATLYGGAASNPWVSPGTTQVLAGDDLTNKRILFFSSQSFRYWALVIQDVQNTIGYSELGVPYIGTYLEPQRGFRLGRRRAALPLTVIQRADRGAAYVLARPAPKSHRLTYYMMTRSDRDVFQTMEDARPHIFFAFNPQNFPGVETLYGVIAQVSEFAEEINDRWTSGEILFEENLG